MKQIKYQSTDEKTVLTALITHSQILAQVSNFVGKERALFKNKWSNVIARWCLDFHDQFKRAPRANIQGLFSKYAEHQSDETGLEIIETYLGTLSGRYVGLAKDMNQEYVMDLAAKFFDRVRLEKVSEKMQLALERNDLEEAKKSYAEYEPVSFASNGFSGSFDTSKVFDTMTYYSENQTLIQLPGAMGTFLSPFLDRDSFVAFAGPEKRGKSFWLQEMVWRGLRQRRRVLYYVLGDMSERQVNFRLYRRAALRPMFAKQLQIPMAIQVSGKDEKGHPTAKARLEAQDFPGLTLGSVTKAIEKLNIKTALKEPRLKLKCAGAGIISASQIESDIVQLCREEWVPDIVVIDYADELAPETKTLKQEFRHQINETWGILRRISLDYHLLMITGTQVASRGYDAWVLRKKDFSEDKRKNAKVTGMLGINQTSEEKASGIYRLNWILLREGEWSDNQVLFTAGNLALSCPCLKACL